MHTQKNVLILGLSSEKCYLLSLKISLKIQIQKIQLQNFYYCSVGLYRFL